MGLLVPLREGLGLVKKHFPISCSQGLPQSFHHSKVTSQTAFCSRSTRAGLGPTSGLWQAYG